MAYDNMSGASVLMVGLISSTILFFSVERSLIS